MLLTATLLACASQPEASDPAPARPFPERLEAARLRLNELRGQELLVLPEWERWTRERYQTWLRERFDTTWPPERAALEARLWALLGLVPRDFPLRERALDRLGQDTRLFFDRANARLVAVAESEEELAQLAEADLVHELTHALQYQRGPLAPKDPTPFLLDDRAWAAEALAEGEATVLEELARGRDPQRLAGRAAAQLRFKDPRQPALLRYLLLEPYLQGVTAVVGVLRNAPPKEGEPQDWSPYDQALRRGPFGSAELLHMASAGFAKSPAEEELPPNLAPLIEGQVLPLRLGARAAQLVLAELSGGRQEQAVKGWRADRADLHFAGPILGEEGTALAWRIRFISGDAAKAFSDTLRALIPLGQPPWPRAQIVQQGARVTILLGIPPSRRERADALARE
ncbi:MAG TPA: hypothetical protein DEA08_34780 [Planctomycetes bacterium]|nr:hypothetical protein [Planctomycetota bacterium]